MHHDRISRRRLLALAGAAAGATCLPPVLPAIARASAATRTIGGAAFGTHWRITLPSDVDTQGLRAEVAALVDELDRLFSPWRRDSVLARFNAGGAAATAVPRELASVTRAALEISARSDGLFDPTVGPLVARWGFGPIAGTVVADGWRHLSVEGDRIVRERATPTLDLCGIAKGHALDRIVTLVERSGCSDLLVDLGGELAARGRHPSGRPWQVAVESPEPDSQEMIDVVSLDGRAIATSGDRVNGYDIGGRRYGHIIDPATAEPVATSLASVSVIAPTGLEADGWATALMAAGERGPALARELALPAVFVFRSEDGLATVATGDFNRHKA